LMKYSGEL